MSPHQGMSISNFVPGAPEKSSESRFAQGNALHLPERKRTGGHLAYRQGRFAQMGMIVCWSSERPQRAQVRSSDVAECQ
jgi:hypothetical protein